MNEKMKNILLALLVTGMAAVFIYVASQHYTLVLFGSLEIPELLFDIYSYGMGALFGYGAVVIWKKILTKGKNGKK